MTDPLDDLKSAMQRATPAPDAARRARTLAEAQKNFAARQETASPLRPNHDRPERWAAFWKGITQMFTTLTRPAALTATTALVAAVVFVSLPATREMLRPGPVDDLRSRTEDTAADRAPEPQPVDDVMVDAPAPAPPMAAKRAAPAADAYVGALAEEAPMPVIEPGSTEAYANADPNPVKPVAEQPVSTFSVDVDTASYALVRQSIMAGALPPPEAVRVEEMINYFPYAYPAPEGGAPFRPTVSLMETPWNADTRLLRIGLQGALPPLADRPPLNLVFLIDTSGSMSDQNKLPLLIQSFRLMLGQLRPTDEVAIVTYAGSSGRVLDPTPAGERSTILAALERLAAGGATAGQEGLQLAYATADEMAGEDEVSRVILATDGDFNVGLSDPEALETYIADKRDSGTYLSVLGFGRGNLDDATMQALAQTGNGQAAYIDTLSEAQKVLVDQLTGVLFPIADDVKVQVEFNPAEVAEYRLIGYETRALRREDFNNDKVDAGEIGAGHQVTALYEVTPLGSPATLNDPLRYGGEAGDGAAGGELAFLRLRAKAPGASESSLTELPIPATVTDADTDARFAAAIAGFGQLLRGSDYLGDWTLDDAIALANSATGEDAFGYRREAVSLMRLAQSLKN
ncbi:vWA domain-containing protein [Oceaniglobus trochenteri]|uniref:vWA domain-containing protein n=1 Tax=Oceaniglobus trochenteri TaxID=2763260 RepID=UPI001CFF8593|nr:VWA domain-containing protein [Oceaniglobus trochenteri]